MLEVISIFERDKCEGYHIVDISKWVSCKYVKDSDSIWYKENHDALSWMRITNSVNTSYNRIMFHKINGYSILPRILNSLATLYCCLITNYVFLGDSDTINEKIATKIIKSIVDGRSEYFQYTYEFLNHYISGKELSTELCFMNDSMNNNSIKAYEFLMKFKEPTIILG